MPSADSTILLSALALLVSGCVDSESTAGYPDDSSQPLVGALEGGLQQSVRVNICSGGCGQCTGVLLGPRTLLTAAHCVAPTVNIQSGIVNLPSNGDSALFDRSRIWVYDSYHHTQDGAPSEAYDVAIVGLQSDIALTVDLADRYAIVSSTRPEDGSAFWLNGQVDDGVLDGDMHHVATTTASLPATDSRYPYQLLDQAVETGNFLIQGGDSGGPLFRERAGEANDGQGGSIAPVVYGVVSRTASYTRLDPLHGWIEARRSAIENAADYTWATCAQSSCTVWMTHDVDGAWEALGTVPQGAKMGVFAQKGNALVVSYPMADRGGKVQVVAKNAFVPAFGVHGSPPTEDLAVSHRYCAAPACTVFAKRDLGDPDMTAIGTVPCGTKMGVFVRTSDLAVVSYPMDDRHRSVQVVPHSGGGWTSSPPGC
jgi:hypothetical protein